MKQDLIKVEKFYKNINFTLSLWGGERLGKKSFEVFSCFVNRGSSSLSKTIVKINNIIRSNYQSSEGIVSSDITFFVFNRYIEFLES